MVPVYPGHLVFVLDRGSTAMADAFPGAGHVDDMDEQSFAIYLGSDPLSVDESQITLGTEDPRTFSSG